MNSEPAIECSGLRYQYGARRALNDLSFSVEKGEIFAFVGPNGGGKTTLFRLLSTLVPLQAGDARLFGLDLRQATREIRSFIGVVFQAPGLDNKLTVAENLRHQGHLYGLTSHELRPRENQLLQQLGLVERRNDLAQSLSGGLRRRVELAKGMLHQPRLLLLDEPSTGLDPGARNDLWSYLEELRREESVTVVLTTHILEEAERADRVAILHEGSLVALDTPDALRAAVGGDSITIGCDNGESLAAEIRSKFDCQVDCINGNVRLEQPDGHHWIAKLVEAFPGRIDSITYARPTLEDVFIDRTGQGYRENDPQISPVKK
jgi:ABC-2 type transport system ATP-binding protein